MTPAIRPVRLGLLLLAMCTPVLSGCGTLGDALAGPIDDHLYYRGVRLDCTAVQQGLPIMALDVPFSACADTLLVPSIAYHQWTDPPGTQHKSLVTATGEALGKSLASDVIVPMTVEMSRTLEAESRKQEAESRRQAPVEPVRFIENPKD